ncbi:hypothetical protein [Sphingomonas sp. G-3-2-10]|uniref:hypothetical protein n=1 Tax=Sphingomonas sp. G-3-2-10 TaxID=2728838 RepID=UPI00146BA8C8|nr:hypothetical protein [Sphingomonas sp. G-3-2-10]NML06859.1 hypothetical protein [Sphingomonas sp. G-3-2-10]
MILFALLLATAAQDPLPPRAKPADPNKITCKEELKTGSRVNIIRICHTAAEWALLRQENRKVIERGQREANWNDPHEREGRLQLRN